MRQPTIADRLAIYRARGITFRLERDSIRSRPARLLTDLDRAWFRANKAAIVAELRTAHTRAGCHAVSACARLGPCPRYVPGASCDRRVRQTIAPLVDPAAWQAAYVDALLIEELDDERAHFNAHRHTLTRHEAAYGDLALMLAQDADTGETSRSGDPERDAAA